MVQYRPFILHVVPFGVSCPIHTNEEDESDHMQSPSLLPTLNVLVLQVRPRVIK